VNIINKKTAILTLAAVLIIAIAVFAYRFDQPLKVEPDPNWEATLASFDIWRESFFVQSGGVELEADLLIPAGGSERKPAVIFSTGSGHGIYQNYAPGMLEKYVLGAFLSRDMAVLLVNKRGMGQSEGNWMHNDIQGRADDLSAAVQHLQSHPSIDPQNIGLMGHSQGGWVVSLTAAQHPAVSFFISLAGPTTSVEEQTEAADRSFLSCQGYEGEELESNVAQQLRQRRLGAFIGKIIPLGDIGHIARILAYDPRQALQTVASPGLLVFGEMDPAVPAEQNLARFDEIFAGNPPDHLRTALISNANHRYYMTDSMCTPYPDGDSPPLSDELVEVIQDWLAELGY
jgi:pimeloyl-ACP methyl ester carboxylesterase